MVWKEGRQYVAQCLEVEVSSFGKTKSQALANLQDALDLYFKDTPLPKRTNIKNPAIASVVLQGV